MSLFAQITMIKTSITLSNPNQLYKKIWNIVLIEFVVVIAVLVGDGGGVVLVDVVAAFGLHR